MCTTASTPCCIALTHAQDKVNVFNLGTAEYCRVNDFDRLDLPAISA